MQSQSYLTRSLLAGLLVGVAPAVAETPSDESVDGSVRGETPRAQVSDVPPAANLGAPTGLATTLITSGTSRPTTITHAPGDESRLFITERSGRIRIIDLETNQLLSTPFLDITNIVNVGTSFGDERGLLGLAFHPDYDENGHFYVNFIGGSGSGFTEVRRYTVSSDNPNAADTSTALTLLTFNQPDFNHNGGWMDFGPDGFLYISTGDGGGAGDTGNNAQNTNNLLGNMLRIDVDNTDDSLNYAIPDDNPFKGVHGFRDEIWAYGLRNPWRNSFDRLTGDLWIADVGQNQWEEVNRQSVSSPGGENYGWRCYEAFDTFNTSGCPGPEAFDFPVFAYSIGFPADECAITGGYVYRGCDIPDFEGSYIFADFCSAEFWAMDHDDPNLPFDPSEGGTNPAVSITNQLSPSVEGFNVNWIAAFGEDARGELYIADLGSGRIFKIIHEDGPQPNPDLNCDGVVDGADLLALLSQWGDCADPDDCPADLTQDGTINGADLLELLSNWG